MEAADRGLRAARLREGRDAERVIEATGRLVRARESLRERRVVEEPLIDRAKRADRTTGLVELEEA